MEMGLTIMCYGMQCCAMLRYVVLCFAMLTALKKIHVASSEQFVNCVLTRTSLLFYKRKRFLQSNLADSTKTGQLRCKTRQNIEMLSWFNQSHQIIQLYANQIKYVCVYLLRVVKGGLDHISRKIKRSFHSSRKTKT